MKYERRNLGGHLNRPQTFGMLYQFSGKTNDEAIDLIGVPKEITKVKVLTGAISPKFHPEFYLKLLVFLSGS